MINSSEYEKTHISWPIYNFWNRIWRVKYNAIVVKKGIMCVLILKYLNVPINTLHIEFCINFLIVM